MKQDIDNYVCPKNELKAILTKLLYPMAWKTKMEPHCDQFVL